MKSAVTPAQAAAGTINASYVSGGQSYTKAQVVTATTPGYGYNVGSAYALEATAGSGFTASDTTGTTVMTAEPLQSTYDAAGPLGSGWFERAVGCIDVPGTGAIQYSSTTHNAATAAMICGASWIEKSGGQYITVVAGVGDLRRMGLSVQMCCEGSDWSAPVTVQSFNPDTGTFGYVFKISSGGAGVFGQARFYVKVTPVNGIVRVMGPYDFVLNDNGVFQRPQVYVAPTTAATPGSDSTGTGTLQAPYATHGKAVLNCPDGAVVNVAPGTYYETLNGNVATARFNTKMIDVKSTTGNLADVTIYTAPPASQNASLTTPSGANLGKYLASLPNPNAPTQLGQISTPTYKPMAQFVHYKNLSLRFIGSFLGANSGYFVCQNTDARNCDGSDTEFGGCAGPDYDPMYGITNPYGFGFYIAWGDAADSFGGQIADSTLRMVCTESVGFRRGSKVYGGNDLLDPSTSSALLVVSGAKVTAAQAAANPLGPAAGCLNTTQGCAGTGTTALNSFGWLPANDYSAKRAHIEYLLKVTAVSADGLTISYGANPDGSTPTVLAAANENHGLRVVWSPDGSSLSGPIKDDLTTQPMDWSVNSYGANPGSFTLSGRYTGGTSFSFVGSISFTPAAGDTISLDGGNSTFATVTGWTPGTSPSGTFCLTAPGSVTPGATHQTGTWTYLRNGTPLASFSGSATSLLNYSVSQINAGLDSARIPVGSLIMVYSALHDDPLQVQQPANFSYNNLSDVCVVNCLHGGPGAESGEIIQTLPGNVWTTYQDNAFSYVPGYFFWTASDLSTPNSPYVFTPQLTPAPGDVISLDGSTVFATVSSWNASYGPTRAGRGTLNFASATQAASNSSTWYWFKANQIVNGQIPNGATPFTSVSNNGAETLNWTQATFSFATSPVPNFGFKTLPSGLVPAVGDTISFNGSTTIATVTSVNGGAGGTVSFASTVYSGAQNVWYYMRGGTVLASQTSGSANPLTFSGNYLGSTAGNVPQAGDTISLDGVNLFGTVQSWNVATNSGVLSFTGTAYNGGLGASGAGSTGTWAYSGSFTMGSDYVSMVCPGDGTFSMQHGALSSGIAKPNAPYPHDCVAFADGTFLFIQTVDLPANTKAGAFYSGTVTASKQFTNSSATPITAALQMFYHGKSWVNSLFVNWTMSPGPVLGGGALQQDASGMRNIISMRCAMLPNGTNNGAGNGLAIRNGSGSGGSNATPMLGCTFFECAYPFISFYGDADISTTTGGATPVGDGAVVDAFFQNFVTTRIDWHSVEAVAPVYKTRDSMYAMLDFVGKAGAPTGFATATFVPSLGVTYDGPNTGRPSRGMPAIPAFTGAAVDPYPVDGLNQPRIVGASPIGSMNYAA